MLEEAKKLGLDDIKPSLFDEAFEKHLRKRSETINFLILAKSVEEDISVKEVIERYELREYTRNLTPDGKPCFETGHAVLEKRKVPVPIGDEQWKDAKNALLVDLMIHYHIDSADIILKKQ